MTNCPDADLIAALGEGKLKRHELPAVLAHLETCVRCSVALEAVNELVAEESAPPQARPWVPWLLAAAVVAGVFAIPAVRERLAPRPSVARLVALAPDDARTVEPRLSGGFAWSAYRGPMRASDPAAGARKLKLGGVAGELAERAERDGSADAQHAAGVAMVLIEQPEDAIARLEAAAARAPTDAKTWSDLAAARYAAASLRGRMSLLPDALAAADRSLALDPRLAEGRFNRALILTRLGLAAQARAAWQHYLAIDGTSPWAAEARERLAKIPNSSGDAQFRRELPRLERAALANDTATVAELVRQYPQQSRANAEADHLGRWGEAVLARNDAEAARLLTVSRAIGNALEPVAGETLLRDAVRAIDGADPTSRARLAEGHAIYRRGRIKFSKQRPADAEPDFRAAAARFEAGRSPMALVARYYAASAAYERNDLARASAELESLLHVSASPALAAQVRWQLALCRGFESDWEGALQLLEPAAATFARLGERGNVAFLESLIASTLVALGRPDDAWAARVRAFEALSANGGGDRLAVSIGGAARAAMRAGRLDAAVPLLHLEQDALRENDVLLANALVREAALHAARGDAEAAMRKVAESGAAARRIADPALRARAENDVEFATAAALLPREPRRAKELLDRAIAGYETKQFLAFLPESYLLRARAAMKLGDREAAAHDLERGITFAEKHRVQLAESVGGTGVLDAAAALFEEAIRLALDRGDESGAFVYAERSRGGAGNVNELTARLNGSGAAVLELVALRDELIAFCVTGAGLTVARHRVERVRLESAGETALYDALIRPSETALAQARQLVIVPDPHLAHVAFAALYDRDTRRHLIERMPVSLATNAFSLRRETNASAPRSVVAIALPSGDDVAALPESDAELVEVTAMYERATALRPQRATFGALTAAMDAAEVVHIAGHTERQPGRGDAALLFANGERVSWKRISASRLGKPSLVVLAACETLRAPADPARQRALSLGGAFLAAGAGAVIGTLTPVADADARALFGAVHRELAAGVGAAEAVRRAQRAAIAADPARRSGGWRAITLITNRITT